MRTKFKFGKEAAFLIGAALIAIVFASVPMAHAILTADARGKVWNGDEVISFLDTPVYYSYIDQAADGAWLLQDRFTGEPVLPYVNVFWIFVGRVARWFRLLPVEAYHAVRLSLIPALVVTAWMAIGAFIPEKRRRVTAFLIFIFGSGIGAFWTGFDLRMPLGLPQLKLPVDLWAPETQAFMSMLFSPHFIASMILLVGTLAVMASALMCPALRRAVVAGAMGALLLSFHPYHFPVVWGVPAAWLMLLRKRRLLDPARIRAFVIYVAISLPPVAYYALMPLLDPHWGELNLTGQTLSTAPWLIAAGLGLTVILAPIGYRKMKRENSTDIRWDFLAVWAVVQSFLMYAPLLFQRRLVEGLSFPLAILAAPALESALGKLRSIPRAGAIAVVAAVFASSNALSVARDIKMQTLNDPPVFYLSRGEAEAIGWLRGRASPGTAVLSSGNAGNVLAGLCRCQVYIGHWNLTLDELKKEKEVSDFYRSMSDAERLRFLENHGIAYVWYGPVERQASSLREDGVLKEAFSNEDVKIFRISDTAR